jgi:hypothetical protein
LASWEILNVHREKGQAGATAHSLRSPRNRDGSHGNDFKMVLLKKKMKKQRIGLTEEAILCSQKIRQATSHSLSEYENEMKRCMKMVRTGLLESMLVSCLL